MYNSKLRTPTQLMNWMRDIEYTEFTQLKSPEEVFLTKSGSCHDQVMFEIAELKNIGVKPIAKFLMAVDKDNIGGETHSFVYWVLPRSAYWVENAWSDFRGLHMYKTEDELVVDVIEKFRERNPNQYIYLSDFDPAAHTIGEDLDTFVDICMGNAELV